MPQAAALLTVSPSAGTAFCAAWSAVRPMVFAVGCSDGRVYIYDLATVAGSGSGGQASSGAQLQPSEVLQPSARPVFSLAFNPRQPQTLASGDGEGHVKLWTLGSWLSTAQQREQDRLEALVQRLSVAEDAEDDEAETARALGAGADGWPTLPAAAASSAVSQDARQ